MNPLAGIDLIFQLLGKSMAFDEKRRTAIDNIQELERAGKLEAENAVAARQRGAIAAGRQRMEGTAVAGQQRLAFAASNLDSSSGTPAATIASSAAFSELDAMTLQNNAIREAYGHEESGRRYRKEAGRLTDKWLAPGSAFFAPADVEFGLDLAGSALGGAAGFGFGGGK